jgi:A/G-specific adenine glycosylase
VAKPARRGNAWWITRDGAQGCEVWLVRREGQGLLGGMRALPDDGWTARVDGDGQEPLPGDWQAMGAVAHVFTHFSLALSVQALHPATVPDLGEGEWWPVAQIEIAGLPTVFARAAARAMATQETDR